MYVYILNSQWRIYADSVIDEQRLVRNDETASGLYLAMRREFETARLDEINNTPIITIVDRAVPPRRPEWPEPVLIIVTAAVLGAALGTLWAALGDLLAHWAARNPAEAVLLRATISRGGGG